jgi:TRAP-type C4-dicarboxylate transport system substrate-binding protein
MRNFIRTILSVVATVGLISLTISSAMAQPAGPILLKFSHQNSPSSLIHEPYHPFYKNVMKRSAGRIKMEYYPAEQLVKSKGDLQGVRSGISDIQVIVTSYNPQAYPLSGLYMLPFAHKSGEEAFRSFMNLKDKYIMPEINKLGVKLLAPYIGCNYSLFTVEKPVRKVEDLKGLKVRSPGAIMNKVLTGFGARPVSITAADLFESLQKRVTDAAVHTAGVLGTSQKVYDATKTGYIIDAGGLGTFVCLILMNKKSWDKLNPDLQKIVEEEGISMGLQISTNYDKYDNFGLQELLDHGVKKIVWDEAEKNKLKGPVMKIWDEEAAKLEAKGFPATQLLNEFKAGR